MRWLACSLALCSSLAFAGDPCVQVTQTKLENGIELWAELSTCSEVTLTVSAAEELNLVNELPATQDSAGRRRFLAARWTQATKGERWSLRDWKYRWKLGRRVVKPPAPVTWRRPFDGAFQVIQKPHGTFSHFEGSQDEEAWDWAMPEGTPVLAARDGVVVGVRSDCSIGAVDEALKNENNYVVLRHEDGTFSEYNHLRQDGVRVRLGDRVVAGQLVGESGNTGYSSRPHLHFSVFHTIDGTLRQELPVTFEGQPRRATRVLSDDELRRVEEPRRESKDEVRKAVNQATEAFEAL